MPNIKQSYQIKNILMDNIYQESVNVLKEMGAKEVKINDQDPNIKEIKVMIPSIWGWGGMNLSVHLEKSMNEVLLSLDGYIAQMAMSPLTKKMDEFLEKLQVVLESKYNLSFEYEKLTRFLPKYKGSITGTDKSVFVIITVVTFLTTILGKRTGLGDEVLITGVVVLLGYFLGKKYLKK